MTADEKRHMDEVAALAGALANAMLNKVTMADSPLHWKDTVFAAALAMKAVGTVAMEMDAAPMTQDETLDYLTRLFRNAMATTVVPLQIDEAGTLKSTLDIKH